jgi:hypothetical protein
MSAELDPVIYGPDGSATFDVERALAAVDAANAGQFRAAMTDLERLGLRQDAAPKGPVPRASVRIPSLVPPGWGRNASSMSDLPNAPGERFWERVRMPRAVGTGDLLRSDQSPGERYWDRERMPRARPMEQPVAEMPPVPLPPETEQYRPVVEQLLYPALCKAFEECRKCGPWFTQPMTWLAPPVTAVSVDVFTPASGVTTTGSYPGPGDCVEVIRIDVPDRWVFILDRFGNELETANAWGDVRFSMQRNRTPIRSYGNFDVQLGRFVEPTRFGSPVILKHKDRFRLQAQSLSQTSHRTYARIMGWAFAVRATSGDGSHNQFCIE